MNQEVLKNLKDIDTQLQQNYIFLFVFFMMTCLFMWFTYNALLSMFNVYTTYTKIKSKSAPKNTKSTFDGEDYPYPSKDDFYLSTYYNEEIIKNINNRQDNIQDTLVWSAGPQGPNSIIQERKNKNPEFQQNSKMDINTLSRSYDNYQTPTKPKDTTSFWYLLTHPQNFKWGIFG